MNEIGLLGIALVATGSTLLAVGITTFHLALIVAGLPVAFLGILGLVDDLILNERIIKRVLKIR